MTKTTETKIEHDGNNVVEHDRNDSYLGLTIVPVVFYYIREIKIPRFRFTDTGDIHIPVPVNRGTTCHLRNSRYSGMRKPIREW
jgi:hypothetical protein